MKSTHKRLWSWGSLLTALVFILVALPSSLIVRDWLAYPLVENEVNASGDVCYVLAGGGAVWERLDAAADLVQMGRVNSILLMKDNSVSQYNFRNNSSWTRTQWITDYLMWRGVPQDRIKLMEQTEGYFGTLLEARAVSAQLPKNVKTLIVVSSAPHMRRSLLAFKRSMPTGVNVVPYAATTFATSYERYHPIWIEYLKLLVYFVIS
jgi:uncharacterized SAM-binding protein YcdF (DUF218 family)